MIERSAEPKHAGPPKAVYLVLLAIVVFVGFIAWGLSESNRAQPISGEAPDFTLTLFEGYTAGLNASSVTLSHLRGRVVVLNFWASWCIPCEEEAPDLEATWRAYRDRGVVFLGIDWTDNYEDGLAYMKRFDISYANGPDMGTKIAPKYGITGVPETFIVDSSGQVVFFKPLPITQQELSAELDRLLVKP
jgi:cytochrome c biogenesis protein CcmG/thiol:disulfide interchange protein DsbE